MTVFNVYILLLVSGCILQLSFITCDSHGYMRSSLLLKSLAALCFVGMGAIAFIGIQDRYAGIPAYPILICCGLAAGAIGDIGLGLRHTLKKRSLPYHISYLVGIVCFLGGHICYLLAAVIGLNLWYVYVLSAIICALIFLRFFFKVLTMTKIYKIVGTVYVCVLFSFVLCAVGTVVHCALSGMILDRAPGLAFFIFAISSIVFTVSDVLTVLNSFGAKKHPTMRLFSLSLYYAAQVGIATSLMFLV